MEGFHTARQSDLEITSKAFLALAGIQAVRLLHNVVSVHLYETLRALAALTCKQ